MFRFIFNFFLFGLLFYLMHLYLPDTFASLVGWADQAVDFGIEMYHKGMDTLSSSGAGDNSGS